MLQTGLIYTLYKDCNNVTCNHNYILNVNNNKFRNFYKLQTYILGFILFWGKSIALLNQSSNNKIKILIVTL